MTKRARAPSNSAPRRHLLDVSVITEIPNSRRLLESCHGRRLVNVLSAKKLATGDSPVDRAPDGRLRVVTAPDGEFQGFCNKICERFSSHSFDSARRTLHFRAVARIILIDAVSLCVLYTKELLRYFKSETKWSIVSLMIEKVVFEGCVAPLRS